MATLSPRASKSKSKELKGIENYDKLMSFLTRAKPSDLISVIRAGAPASVIDDVQEHLGIAKNEFLKILHLPQSTADRKKNKHQRLEAAITERLLRILRIQKESENVFGSKSDGMKWLKSANWALGGATPLQWCDTDVGADEVYKILGAIAYGGAV